MRKILTSFSLVAASLAFAQVGINADENDIAKDAVFHVKNNGSEAKGVILPSVSLTGEQDQTTITTGLVGISQVTTGLMVWNDGTAGLTPAGYYYWDGTKWVLTGNVKDSVKSRDIGYKFNRVTTLTPSSFDGYDGVIFTSGISNVVPNPSGYEGKSIILINDSSYNVTIQVDGSADILPSAGIRNNQSIIIASDGTNWYRISS